MAFIKVNNQDVFVNTNETKEQFIEKAQKEAKGYELLKQFYVQVFEPVINKFNGKPLNNRFVMALQTAALDLDENITISNVTKFEDGTSYIHVNTGGESDYSYNHAYTLYIVEKFAGSDKRLINSAATIRRNQPYSKDRKTKADELQYLADSCKASIEHYDEYMAQVAGLKQLIDQYNQVPYCFHSHINRDFLYTY